MSGTDAKWVDCPQCDPCNPECDEDGRPYTCFFCCDTGRVLASVLEEALREADERDAKRPPPAPYPRQPARVPNFAHDDDIPF